VLVVGDETTLKVHLHTDEPELATAVFAGVGDVSRLDVADMRLQVSERDGRVALDSVAGRNGAGPDAAHAAGRRVRCGAVAVVSGDGVRDLFHELHVHTVDGGPTLNPSTYDLLAAIHAVPAEEVIVLANSPNVVMAAENAARLSEKQVLVAPTTSQQAGLAAAVALVQDRPMEENAQALLEAVSRVRTGAVAQAARDDALGRFSRGDAVGFVEDEVLAWGDPAETLRAVLAALADGEAGADAPELISVLAGEDAPLRLGQVETMAREDIELELRHGGQTAYWWLLAAE
jgi:dihydroxyacetone kinase-like predicted kinase